MKNYILNNLSGLGLELGAFYTPFPYSENTKMDYCDVRTRDELIEVAKGETSIKKEEYNLIPETAIFGTGDSLIDIDNDTYDFTCSCHVLEHVINFGKAIEESLRVTKKLGKLYCIVPDKRFTFDKDKKETTYQELVDIYESEPILNYDEVGYGHKNRFTDETVFNFLKYLNNTIDFNIQIGVRNGMNIIFLLQKL